MRYGRDLGCRFSGQPHNIVVIHENKFATWEKCTICGKRFKWNKGYKGRIKNEEYLKAHVREFAQNRGATKRVYNKLYNIERTIIKI